MVRQWEVRGSPVLPPGVGLGCSLWQFMGPSKPCPARHWSVGKHLRVFFFPPPFPERYTAPCSLCSSFTH